MASPTEPSVSNDLIWLEKSLTLLFSAGFRHFPIKVSNLFLEPPNHSHQELTSNIQMAKLKPKSDLRS